MAKHPRFTAKVDGDFVVFLIGLRIHRPLAIHRWLPVMRAMPRMLDELHRQPELGLMHAEMWFARTTIMVQYWRSMEQLLAYATCTSAQHLPAWRAFNKSAGRDRSVGIWHETYAAEPGSYETMYVNMPPFGLGKAGTLRPASGTRNTAAGRLHGDQRSGFKPCGRGDADARVASRLLSMGTRACTMRCIRTSDLETLPGSGDRGSSGFCDLDSFTGHLLARMRRWCGGPDSNPIVDK